MQTQEAALKPTVKFTQLSLAVSPHGNSFGHDKHNPQFLRVDPIKRGCKPPVILRLMARLEDLYDDLRRPRWRMAALQSNRTRRTHRVRRMYSQRREAVVRLLQVIVAHTNLLGMVAVAPDRRTGQLEPVSLAYLADKAGMGLKRADRAMADIEAMGLVYVRQRRRLGDAGEWRSCAAIRRVSPLLFALFGLGNELKAAQRRKKRQAPVSIGMGPLKMDTPTSKAFAALGQKRMIGAVKDALGGIAKSPRKAKNPHYTPDADYENRENLRNLIAGLDSKRREELG